MGELPRPSTLGVRWTVTVDRMAQLATGWAHDLPTAIRLSGSAVNGAPEQLLEQLWPDNPPIDAELTFRFTPGTTYVR